MDQRKRQTCAGLFYSKLNNFTILAYLTTEAGHQYNGDVFSVTARHWFTLIGMILNADKPTEGLEAVDYPNDDE
ncbi:hypothetical protein [Limosilactobacillus sp.]|jgi:hypothetical protein|uniref:hypothetical protein n=1 Tax=Limosilactobacillus sp. TaxID=2773925 RepID=UPI0025B7D81B|nr:hypothetical protein [Limosilactobacillus sp.]MCH3921634.1 hypothetical protein [Limosilactobacillus sp.]MCH3928405.1 hypothetical protein [Limosilactobacillus sp.]